MHLRKIGYEDGKLMGLSLYHAQWRGFVLAVLNL